MGTSATAESHKNLPPFAVLPCRMRAVSELPTKQTAQKGRNIRRAMTGQLIGGEILFTVREAAEQTGLAYATIWSHFKRGKLMKTKLGGKTMVRQSELEKLIRDVPVKRERADV
jgi:excisionase family DNA binding protein